MKRTVQAKLLIFTVFIVGVLTGAVLMDVYETRVFSSDDREERRGRFLDGVDYAEYLQLTQEQDVEITGILESVSESFRELREQAGPQYQRIRDEARSDIRELLTEPQREFYDAWIEDERQRTRDRDRGRPTP